MSFIDIQKLKGRHDTTLKSFSRNVVPDTSKNSYIIDTIGVWDCYWTSVYVRNGGDDVLTYRTQPHGNDVVMQKESEIIIDGWGSYLSMHSIKPLDVNISFNLVLRGEAIVI